MATKTFSASASALSSVPKGDSLAAVEAAVAVLEADGATPTQAHVNSLRTVWNTQKAGNVIITIDTAQITTLTQLRAALDAAMVNVVENNFLTP